MAAAALLLAATGLGAQQGARSLLALDAGGKVLAAENADQLSVPASVAKLWVTAAALHHLGPEFRVRTEITTGAKLDAGVLQGELVLRAAGDPTWNARFHPGKGHAALHALAQSLFDRGLRGVRGDLVVDVGRWPGRGTPQNRSVAEVPLAYGAATSAAAIDENTVKVEIAPGEQVGQPARARFLGAGFEIEIDNHMVTAPRERHGVGTVEILPVWHEQRLILRGEYPISEPAYPLDVALPDPEYATGLALRAALDKVGITVSGKVAVRAVEPGGAIFASYDGFRLADWLPAMLADSNNWYAEMLARQLAMRLEGAGRSDRALRLLETFAEEVVGSPKGAVRLDDACGLSPYNLVTPRATVDLLRWANRQPWSRLFLDALAAPKKGTLSTWPDPPAGLRAKTGTVQNALGLAGYLPRPGGDATFAIFLNARPDRAPLRREIVDQLRKWQR